MSRSYPIVLGRLKTWSNGGRTVTHRRQAHLTSPRPLQRSTPAMGLTRPGSTSAAGTPNHSASVA